MMTLTERLVLVGISSVLVLSIVGVIGGVPWGIMSDYSEGQRAGVVLKISKKGVVFKSWEGAMNLGGTSTDGNGIMVPNLWEFSVEDDAVAHALERVSLNGHRVVLKYKQWWHKPWSLSTEYRIVEVAEPEGDK